MASWNMTRDIKATMSPLFIHLVSNQKQIQTKSIKMLLCFSSNIIKKYIRHMGGSWVLDFTHDSSITLSLVHPITEQNYDSDKDLQMGNELCCLCFKSN
jgi:type II restriction/modification system DNA methylase subunit YeeA